MTTLNSTSTLNSAPQKAAHWLFHHFKNWRALAFLAVITVLTVISIRFNYALGELMASDALTRELFPAGFGSLDVCALLLASWLSIKGAPFIRKAIAWAWFSYLLSLSVFACMSFVLASDARLAQSGYDAMRDSKVRALQQAEAEVETAQRNYQNTSNFKQLRKAELIHAQQYRDKLIRDVGKLDSENPHVSQAIFFRIASLLNNRYEPEGISTAIRMCWSLALVLSPFIMVGLLAFEIGSTHGSTPTSGSKKRFSLGESEHFGQNKWPNFNSSPSTAPMRAELSESPQKQGRVDGKATLNREALAKVREWLEGETGRVTRNKIKYRSGNLNYENVSLIIESLLSTGHLERMGNGQLRVGENRLKAVV